MTDIRLSTITSEDTAPMGPLERVEAAANSIVLQLGLYAEMQQTIAEGKMTPELEQQFAAIFAATTEAAIA